MEAAFYSSGDTVFNYGYGCCAFTHNIRGSKPQIPDGMPKPSVPLIADFFANPRCPPGALVAASTSAPIAVSGEKHSKNSPVVAEEEVVLPTYQEEVVLLTDLLLCFLALYHPDQYSFFFCLMSLLGIFIAGGTNLYKTGCII